MNFSYSINECLKKYPVEYGDINGFRNCVYGQCGAALTLANGGKPIDGNTLRSSICGKNSEIAVTQYALATCKNPEHYKKVPPSIVNIGCIQQPGNSFYSSFL